MCGKDSVFFPFSNEKTDKSERNMEKKWKYGLTICHIVSFGMILAVTESEGWQRKVPQAWERIV